MKPFQSLLLVIISFCSFAQLERSADAKLLGKINAFEYKHLREFPIRTVDDHFYEVRFDKESARLVKYSEGVDKPKVIVLSTDGSGISGDVYFADFFEFSGKYVGLLRENIAGKDAKFYLQEIDKESYRLIGKPRFLGQSNKYRMGWWNGEYLVGSPDFITSQDGKFLCVELKGISVDGKPGKKIILYNYELNRENEYSRVIEEFENSKYSNINVTDKGRILELVGDRKFWESYYEGDKSLPPHKDKIYLFYKGEESIIQLKQDGEIIRNPSVYTVENEKLYMGGTYVTFSPKKSKTPGESMVSLTIFDLEKEEGERLIVNEHYPVVYNDLNKYMLKEEKAENDKFFNKNGYHSVMHSEIGINVSQGKVFIAFRRESHYNSELNLSQCITVLKFEDFNEPPQIGFLPMNSLLYDSYSYAKNGKIYFLVLTESSNVGKKFTYDKLPKKLAHYSSKTSFCIAEVGFGNNAGYSFKEFDNSESYGKARPQMDELFFIDNDFEKFSILGYKESGTGYSQEHFRIYSVEYED
ncbi:MAG: hypothetical protein CL840_20875 [Crocinitomicaceae bacterium]|nr:hypothetical protein [Crocinitomicaceae bacterium]|tara:strand:- start:12253 stop:13833 length:1581 start_codon:yes stop_codon:yes gene_type:complete